MDGNDEDDREIETESLVYEASPGTLTYSPRLGELALVPKGGETRPLQVGRLLVGCIVGEVGRYETLLSGQDVKIRRAIFNVSFDSRLRPLRALAKVGLSYFSVAGTAITLLGAVDPLVTLAKWAKYLVSNWFEWTYWMWASLFKIFSFHLPREFEKFLTISSLCLYMALVSKVSRNDSEDHIQQYEKDLYSSVMGMSLISIVMLLSSTKKGDVHALQPLVLVGGVLLLLCWVLALIMSNLGSF